LDLIGVFKELAEGKRNLNLYIKSNAGIISYNKFSNTLKDINKKGDLINNISTSMIIKLLNNKGCLEDNRQNSFFIPNQLS
jgi:hypothetical protein